MGQSTSKPGFRFRPGWHRAVGWISLAAGIAIIAANDLMLLADATFLPGGHSELYLMAGIGVAATSLWWFGWMDRQE